MTSWIKVTNPKEVVFEGSRDVRLKVDDPVKRYYVYAKGDLAGIYTFAADAVLEASSLHGVVTDKRMTYIWESENRKSEVRLTNLEVKEGEGGKPDNTEEGTDDTGDDDVGSSYVKCLDTMLKSGGVYKSTQEEARTKSLVKVLSDNLDADVLDLSGCSLSDVLYYVSQGYPVMAMTGEGGAVIIMGYDSKNTILYDPKEDRVYKMGMNDSGNMFERAGNRFISYVW